MKPTFTLRNLYLLFGLCLMVTACDKKLMDDGGESPFHFYIGIQDADGHDLLNPNIEGNITKNDIKAIYRGEIYHRTLEDNNSFLETVKTEKGDYLLFLGFWKSQCHFETIVIDWGNGSKDVISFDATQEGYSYIPLYLNGELITDHARSFYLKIIK